MPELRPSAVTRAELDKVAVAGSRGQNGIWCVPNVGYALSGNVATASFYRVARFVPTRTMTIVKIGFCVTNAATADDSVDVGLYDSSGTRLVSSGATAGKVNSTGAKTINITSTTLVGGTAYYAGMAYGAVGGTAATILAFAGTSVFFPNMFTNIEVHSAAGATLPATTTPASGTSIGFALAALES